MDLKLLLLIILFSIFTACDNRTQKEKFDKHVYNEFYSNYGGLITEKYIDENDHNRHLIKLKHEIFGVNKKDLTFQSLQLFDFIQIGDTILKDNESIKLQIKRRNLDTLIPLDFGNVKGKDLYYWENQYVKQEFN